MTVLIAGLSPFVAVRQFWRLWGPLVQCMPMENAGNLRKLNRHKKSARGCLPWADEISNLIIPDERSMRRSLRRRHSC